MEFLQPYLVYITLGVTVFCVLEFFLLISLNGRQARTSKMLRSLFAGPEGSDLEALLTRVQQESGQALKTGEDLETRLDELTSTTRGCIQHFGLVRYDAFGDVSGQQSFSLVFLDSHRNGVAISGLFSRANTRCYGKAIIAGSAEQNLSEEEEEAMRIALSDSFSAPNGRSQAKPRRGLLRRKEPIED